MNCSMGKREEIIKCITENVDIFIFLHLIFFRNVLVRIYLRGVVFTKKNKV
jgi:hypothetical protein